MTNLQEFEEIDWDAVTNTDADSETQDDVLA